MPSSTVDLQALPSAEQSSQIVTQSSHQGSSEPLRLGLTERYGCVLVAKEFQDVFDTWWATTYYRQRCLRREKCFSKPNFGLQNCQSEAWKEVVEAADRSTETPCVLCVRCKAKLVHPNNHNTIASNLKSHFSSSVCQKSSIQKQLSERRMQTVLEVSLIVFISHSKRLLQ